MEGFRTYLIPIGLIKSKSCRMEIKSDEFKIGRCKTAQLCVPDVNVSRNHCIISCFDNKWWLKNESQVGTIVNGKVIGNDEKCRLHNEDVIQLGPLRDRRYKFCIESCDDGPPSKSPKMEFPMTEDLPSEKEPEKEEVTETGSNGMLEEEIKLKKQNEELKNQLQKVLQEKEEVRLKYEEERTRIESELLSEKVAFEQQLKEMESLLSSKEKEQQNLSEKLRQTDEENAKLVALRHEAAVKAESMIAALRSEVLQKELSMRETLELEMKNLLDNRMEIEERIRVEKEQLEGACAKKLQALEEELSHVKQDLTNAEGKKFLLEKELEEAELEKEKGSKAALIAKRETLMEFSNLIEMELQCSICSELFVKATTLNCTHTACHFCLQEWKKKKNTCPMCRAPVVTESHSIVLDSFIDKIVENLSEEMKRRRLEIIEERKALEVLSTKAPKKHVRKTKPAANVNAAVSGYIIPVQPSTSRQIHSNQNEEIIVIGIEDDDHMYTRRIPNPSLAPPNHRHGGACYVCGRRGHWAQSCPYHPRNS